MWNSPVKYDISKLERQYMKNNELGENIYFLRKRKKLTQEDFAKKMKISNKTISKWETGYSIPKFDDLLKISKYFNVPINVLINKELLDNYKIKCKFTRYLSFDYIKYFLFIFLKIFLRLKLSLLYIIFCKKGNLL